MMISPYNTALPNLMKSNMNLQFVKEIYGLLAYLCSYICKEEGKLDETLMKFLLMKPSNELYPYQ